MLTSCSHWAQLTISTGIWWNNKITGLWRCISIPVSLHYCRPCLLLCQCSVQVWVLKIVMIIMWMTFSMFRVLNGISPFSTDTNRSGLIIWIRVRTQISHIWGGIVFSRAWGGLFVPDNWRIMNILSLVLSRNVSATGYRSQLWWGSFPIARESSTDTLYWRFGILNCSAVRFWMDMFFYSFSYWCQIGGHLENLNYYSHLKKYKDK